MKTYKQKKIEKMLKTNTGAHMLDSGGAYGRHHERNAKKKLDFLEDIKLNYWGCTIPVHVYMDTMLELNDITAMFNRILSRDYYWVQEAYEYLVEKGFELEEPYAGGGKCNTYNHDNDLSQDFQYQLFEYDGDTYCLFQLHNGCDIRGGYTSTQVFLVPEIDYFFIGMNTVFYDNSTHEQFESYYQISEDEKYELDEKEHCFVNKETKDKVYPYLSAMGY